MLRNTVPWPRTTIELTHHVLPLRRRRETPMKTCIILLLALAATGCSMLRAKPYQASDTTASASGQLQAPGPTQRSTQRMFNPDGSLGTYFGT